MSMCKNKYPELERWLRKYYGYVADMEGSGIETVDLLFVRDKIQRFVAVDELRACFTETFVFVQAVTPKANVPAASNNFFMMFCAPHLQYA